MSLDARIMYRIISLLEKSKTFSDQAFAAMPGAILALDANLRILRANDGAAKLFNESTDSIIGLTLEKIISHLDYAVIQPQLLDLFRGGAEAFEIEAPVRNKKGQLQEYHWQFRRFSVGKNKAIVNVIGRDISELKQVLRSKMELETDLDLAKSTQQLLLPETDTAEGDGWRLAAFFEPAVKAGGDWWKYDRRPDGSVVVFLGDVSGHGVASAMVTAMILGCHKAALKFNPQIEVPVFFAEFDQQLRNLMNGNYWMTLFALDINPAHGVLDWYCAAAPSAYLLSTDGTTVELSEPGRPLGSGDLLFRTGRQAIKPGDRIFCATDGAFDLHLNVSEMTVKRAIMKILKEPGRSEVQVRDEIKVKLTELRENHPAHDDTSFIVLDIK